MAPAGGCAGRHWLSAEIGKEELSERSATAVAPARVADEAARRRNFAVISHPDAGKSTITEALALHARVIGQAGAVHGKAALSIGDTLYTGAPARFPPLPSFAPEHFAVIRATDSSAYKSFRRGIGQLDAEGVVRVLRSTQRGDQAPVLAAVGPMQFEVATERLATEFGVPTTVDHLPYQLARRTDRDGEQALQGTYGVEVLTRDRDGVPLALFPNNWRLQAVQREHPELTLEPLLVDTGTDTEGSRR